MISSSAISRSKEGHPLSFSQKRLWFLFQLDPANWAFNEPLLLELRGDLNIGALRFAINDLIVRHESLRTVFSEVDGNPRQRVLDNFEINFVNEQGGAETERDLGAWIQIPFNLQSGPPMRVRLIQTFADQYFLAFNFHHIICDGWSFRVFLEELKECYEARVQGRNHNLAPLPIQYIDFSEWYSHVEKSPDYSSRFEKLVANLRASEPLVLPTGLPRPAETNYHGTSIRFPILGEGWTKLEEFASSQNATAFSVVFAAFQALLWKYTGQEQFAVGVPSASRSHVELENIFGLFANTLPIRCIIEPTWTVSKFIESVQAETLYGFSNQDIPFEKVVEELNPDRTVGQFPVFQTLFNKHVPLRRQFEMSGVQVSVPKTDLRNAKLDLSFAFEELADGSVDCELQYSEATLETGMVHRMPSELLHLLDQMQAHPNRSLAELTVFEKKDWLDFENVTLENSNSTLDELFIRSAKEFPGRVALVCDGCEITYQELDRKSDLVAAYLQSQDIAEECVVAVAMPRSVDSIVCLLGILKAGACYLPLDIEEPKERLEEKLLSSGARMTLTSLDPLENMELPKPRRPGGNRQRQAAYILFTSGSTGTPKAVVVEHGNVSHYTSAVVQKMWELIGKPLNGLNFATVTTLTADLGNTTMFASLALGGTLHLLTYETATDSSLFEHYMVNHLIDVLKIVPSHFSALFQTASALPQKLLVFGGETLPADLVQKIYSEKPSLLICNHYGPTETCIGSIMTELPLSLASNLSELGTMPLGRPLGQTVLAVLDSHRMPVPEGAIGELYIGGPGVSRGYLNDSDLTNRKFVQIPGSSQRFYRTGDFVRRSKNHNYYFQGRKDDQVKIRGFRVELAEVEGALRSLVGVAESAILVHRDPTQKASVIGFVEPLDLDGTALIEKLWTKLPSHMVPQRIISVSKLPRSKNGKVDRKALEKLVLPETAQEARLTPANDLENALFKSWHQLLGAPPASREENFFRAGGHSLLAIQLVSKLRAELNIQIPVRRIFQSPRFCEIVMALSELKDFKCDPVVPKATDHSRATVTASQERLWFLCKIDPTNPFYNEPLALRLTGQLQINLLEKAFIELQSRHEQLRAVFSEHRGRLTQEIGSALEIRLTPTKVERTALDSSIRNFHSAPFDFAKPLIRVELLTVHDGDHILLVCAHHIICDGWSMQILVRDLAEIYNSLATNQPVAKAQNRVTYAEFVGKPVSSEGLESSIRRLQSSETLNLPLDYPRPSIQKHRGRTVKSVISAETAGKIRDLAQRMDATVFNLMLSAFEVLLYRHTAQTNFAIGLPVANRTDARFEDVVGMFVNTLAIPVDIADEPFVQILKKVCETSIEGLEYQDLPFDLVVQKLNPVRNLSHSPIFQVLFVYSNSVETPNMLGLEIDKLPCDLRVAKYDLALGVEDLKSDQLICEWEYDTALFNEETIVRFANHFECLLNSILENPEENINRLHLLPESEEKLILREWNDTRTNYDGSPTINEKIEQTCLTVPNHVALSFEGKETTYAELKNLSSRIVTCLRNAHVNKNDLVGIMMERSTEMVVSLLGILKAGAAYVPIDPNYPADRVRYMIEDSQPKILLTQKKLASIAESMCGERTRIICVDEELEHLKPSFEDVTPAPEDLAYMIYTSGSTGRPKGAMNGHAGIYNRLAWMQKEYQLTSSDVVLQKTPFSFDVSVWEFFWPLMFGAKMVIARPEGHKDPNYLIDVIQRENVTTIHFVPSMLHAFLANDRVETCDSLKRVVCSGEALSYDLQTKFFDVFAESELHNLYGPTEAAVDVTYWKCDRSDTRGIVPIGRPIDNIQIYILDPLFKPVPIGIAGELYISGVGVGKGYFNKPELTDEKFIADPFFSVGKMYRTGDRARFLPDGSIEYLGRLDNQVKLRGFRIELGEIEVAISETPNVVRSVVMIRESAGQQKELVAYVVTADGRDADSENIMQALKERLPEHMVPTAYVTISSVPVSPSGKVDYKQLPAPTRAKKNLGNREPETDVELEVAGLWAGILGHSDFGTEDSFFDVGGNSLLLLQVQSRLNQSFSKRVELTELFRSPTVTSLARSLSDEKMSDTPIVPQNSVAQRRAGLSGLANRRRS